MNCYIKFPYEIKRVTTNSQLVKRYKVKNIGSAKRLIVKLAEKYKIERNDTLFHAMLFTNGASLGFLTGNGEQTKKPLFSEL